MRASMALDGAHQVALHDLRMVDVELELQVVGPDLVHDGEALPGPVDEEPWNVAAVDRLQQEFDPGRLQRLRRDRRFATSVRRAALASTPFGRMPARQLTRGQSRAFA